MNDFKCKTVARPVIVMDSHVVSHFPKLFWTALQSGMTVLSEWPTVQIKAFLRRAEKIKLGKA